MLSPSPEMWSTWVLWYESYIYYIIIQHKEGGIQVPIQDVSETYVIKSTPASKESQFPRDQKVKFVPVLI